MARSCVPDPEFRAALPTIGGSLFALAVLFSMNLLNYVDRYSFFAVGTQIQSDLHINDDGFGLLGAAFMIVYTIVAPLMGWLGDRYSRRVLLAGGVGLWSFATVGSAFAQNFPQMFFWRALLGVGEASYGVIAPALLADLFPPRHRGRVMGLYFLALPLGGAVGYGLGGWIARRLELAGGVLGRRPARPGGGGPGLADPRSRPRRVGRARDRGPGRPAPVPRLPGPVPRPRPSSTTRLAWPP